MSQALFPSLPGQGWPVHISLLPPPVAIRTTPSRREFRSRDATQPQYQITVPFDVLRGRAALAEWQALRGFYLLRGGAFDDFLFKDTGDCTVTAGMFGVGNGATTQFQLVRTLGGYAEPVYGLSGTPTLYANGAALGGGYSIDNFGLVNFSAPPAVGVSLTWSGTFCWRVRFLRDQLDATQLMRDFWEAKKVELLTVKPT